MNSVDVGDQLWALNDWKHRWCINGDQKSFAQGFLLSMACVNSYLLDNAFGIWKDLKKGHLKWREALVLQLFNAYALAAESRKRARLGCFDDKRKDNIDLSMYKEGNRGKRGNCVMCLVVSKKRRPLEEVGLRINIRGPNIRWGCLTYDIALCPTDFCWDLFYNSKIGVV